MYVRALLLFIFPGAIIFSACNAECSKKVNCPGFEDKILTYWFPYGKDSILIFSSNSSTEVFHLKNTETTTPYEITVGGYGGGSGDCFATKQFGSAETDTTGFHQFSVSLEAHLATFTTTPHRSVRLKLNNNTVYGTDLKETGFGAIDINGHKADIIYHPSLEIETKKYNDVQTAVLDTSSYKTTGIFQLYFSEGAGLVAYREYPSLLLKVKQ